MKTWNFMLRRSKKEESGLKSHCDLLQPVLCDQVKIQAVDDAFGRTPTLANASTCD
jgi:hypothetical protein